MVAAGVRLPWRTASCRPERMPGCSNGLPVSMPLIALVCGVTPGGTPGSTAGRRPAATYARIDFPLAQFLLICGSMSASADTTFAWEPLTPRGVAAFAHARLSRLLLVQFVIASLAAAAVVWFLSDGCFPTVRVAIRNLPAAGEIHAGRLDWPGHLPQLLAEGRFLAFIVDPNHSGQIHSPADVQIEFGAGNRSRFFAARLRRIELSVRSGSSPSTAPNWSRFGARGSRNGWPSRSWPSLRA